MWWGPGRSPHAAARLIVASICWQRRRGSSSRSPRTTDVAPSRFRPLRHSSNRNATTGTPVAGVRGSFVMVDVHQQIAAARERLARMQRAHPDAFLAAAVFTSVITLVLFAGSLWLVYEVAHDLPT